MKGVHSVDEARRYSGRLGKTENPQVAVSLSVANTHGSLPLDYRLYLPKEWTEDAKRCERAGVPREIEFRTKGQIARTQIEAALAAGVPRGVVLAAAGYGDETAFAIGFARVRVRAAHRDKIRDEEWLLIEWPHEHVEPTHYFPSTLPAQTSFKRLVAHPKGRSMIERDYQELKSEFGLSDYEGA